jgi:outer membrane protein TolC
MIRKRVVFFACITAAACSIGAQEAAQEAARSPSGALPVLTLQDALGAASASGDDFIIATSGLDVAKKQRALDLAKQGFSLSATGGYQLSDGLGNDGSAASSALTSYDQGLISKAAAASTGASAISSYQGISQAPQGSLALSGPLTKATLSATQSIPVPTPVDATNPPTTFNSPQYSVVGLNVAQTIWDGYPGYQYAATLQQSLLTYRGKELSTAQGLSAAVTKVKQAYIAMLAAQRDLEVKKQVLSNQQSLLAQIQATFAMRQATAVDLKTAQVNARSAAIDVETADKTLRLANERLAVIMGGQPDERFAVADLEDPAMPAASIDEAISIGLQKRTDLAQLDIDAKSSRISAGLARAQAKPNISLTGGAGMAIGWSPYQMAGAISVGAKVALPIFDSGVADLTARTSEGQAALYDTQASQLRKTLSSDIRDDFESAQLQLEKVGLAKDSMDLADAQFELTKAQNKYGTATLQDVLTASVTAASAEEGYQTAKSAFLSAVLTLSTAMGL